MAESDLDSDLSAGTSSSPNGGGSQGKGDSSGSFDASKLQSMVEALTRKLDEVDERSKSLQGDKDRGVNQTKDEVKELKRKIAEIEKLKKSGLDEDGAIEEHSFREEIRTVKDQLSKLVSTQVVPTGNGENLVDEVAKVFAEFGLDPNHPEAQSLYSLKGTELIKGVAKLKIKSQSTSVDSSEATSLQGGSPPVKAGVEKLTEQYQKDMLENRGNPPKLKAIKEKAIKDGVPVESVVFH
jgi:DNA repair exonuclease SbcCD ATPase subunit